MFLALAGFLAAPPVAQADESTGTKPPIVVKQGNTTYTFTTQDEKFRQMLLRSKNLHIHLPKKKSNPESYYKDYYQRHRYIRDYEKEEERNRAAYESGYAAGYFMKRD